VYEQCKTVNTSLAQFQALLARQQLLNQQHHKHLARKIHDEISQKMTLLALQLSMASSDNKPPANWDSKCKDWANLVMELGQTIREITSELQPRIVDEFGLAGALRWLAQSSANSICCAFIAPGDDISLPPLTANAVFAICREIVMDVLAPAGIGRVEIELEQKDAEVRLSLRINDNEQGHERLTEKDLAPISMQDRMLCLDGSAELCHSSETGTMIILTVPAGRPLACCATP
jgi:signal transduction histidine kinase